MRDELLTRLENTYQRAFHELNFHMGSIEAELAKTAAASTPEQAMIRLAAVWRQAYAAQEKIGQIPLGVVELQNTEQYLGKLGDYVLSIASSGIMPSHSEREALDQLAGQARELANQLTVIQAGVLGNNVRWTALEVQTLNDTAPRDSGLLAQVREFERQIEEFPEISFGEHVNVNRPAPTALTEDIIPREEAVEKAREFIRHLGADLELVGEEDVPDSEVPHYSLAFAQQGKNGRRIVVEVIRNGGRVFQMFAERSPGQPVISVNDAQTRASRFLAERGVDSVILLGVEEWGNSAVFTYCHTEDGILFYPDLLRVRVAQDDGEILSYEGNGFAMYHRERGNFSDQLGSQGAMERLNDTLTVAQNSTQRVVIFDRRGVEVLCYEFLVSRGQEQFLIYINAQNGREENIVRLVSRPLATVPAWTAGW
jgi:spore germination protein